MTKREGRLYDDHAEREKRERDFDRWVQMGATILELFPEFYDAHDGLMTRADIRAHLLDKGWQFEEWELDAQLKEMTEANQLAFDGDFFECLLLETENSRRDAEGDDIIEIQDLVDPPSSFEEIRDAAVRQRRRKRRK